MFVNQRLFKKEFKSKSDCTLISTHECKFQGTLMYTLFIETSNYVNLMPSQSNSKSVGTLMSTPNSKDDEGIDVMVKIMKN